MTTINLSVPHTGETPKSITVDPSKLPANVVARLVETAYQGRVRSGVNNAFNLEYDKALTAAKEAWDTAETAKKTADKSYKVAKFDEKAFKAAFSHTTDAMEVAAKIVADLEAGTIRVRGSSTGDKLLTKAIKQNIVMTLVAKGKKQRDAIAMVGDDPMAFLATTARKRAGEDDEAYTVELAKLHAQYVDPAKALLAPEEASEDGEDGEEDNGADDLI